jgi:hypothetical protein
MGEESSSRSLKAKGGVMASVPVIGGRDYLFRFNTAIALLILVWSMWVYLAAI